MRGLYNNEYIQIYFIYNIFPDIYFISDIKIQRLNYKFGIYYFTRGVSLINNQINEDNIKKEMKTDIAKTLNIKNKEERKKI